jgi:hypothetical protein
MLKNLSVLLLISVSLVFFIKPAHAELNNPSDFPVEVYKGKLRNPKGFNIDQDGNFWEFKVHNKDKNSWEFNKMIIKPQINFAGKYFITLHSCGTGCRYYRMHDLTSGKELAALKMFASAEPTPKTKDGWEYITRLHHEKDSNLLVAQFLLEKRYFKDEEELEPVLLQKCRERSYVFDFENEVLKPISKTRYTCTDYDNIRMPRKFWNKSP